MREEQGTLLLVIFFFDTGSHVAHAALGFIMLRLRIVQIARYPEQAGHFKETLP